MTGTVSDPQIMQGLQYFGRKLYHSALCLPTWSEKPCSPYLVLIGQSALGPFCLPTELAKSPVVLADVSVVLPLDELDEVLHDPLIKVLTCTKRSLVDNLAYRGWQQLDIEHREA